MVCGLGCCSNLLIVLGWHVVGTRGSGMIAHTYIHILTGGSVPFSYFLCGIRYFN